MKPRLLVTRQIFDEVLVRLVDHFEVESNQSDAEWSRAELITRARDKDALFVVTSDRVDAELLAACPRLRMVSTGSVGFNHIDVKACVARGVMVSNTPDVLNEATADMAWALLMAAARRAAGNGATRSRTRRNAQRRFTAVGRVASSCWTAASRAPSLGSSRSASIRP